MREAPPASAAGSPAGIEVRAPLPHEVDAFAGCVEVAFAIQLQVEEREALVAGLNARCLAAFETGELVGTLGAYEVELTLPGPVTAPALVLEDVAVLPTHRRRGVLSALLRAALEQARRQGPELLLLQASDGAIYGRYGFGPAVLAASYRLRRPAATMALTPELAEATGRGRVRLLTPPEALEAFPALHEELSLARPGEVARRAADWPELVSGAPAGAPPRLRVAFELDGQLDGYAVYDLLERPGTARRLTVQLVELAAVTPVAYAALWSYLLELDPADELITGPRPIDEPLRHLLADPRALEVEAFADRSWLRLVDVAGSARGPPLRRARAAGDLARRRRLSLERRELRGRRGGRRDGVGARPARRGKRPGGWRRAGDGQNRRSGARRVVPRWQHLRRAARRGARVRGQPRSRAARRRPLRSRACPGLYRRAVSPAGGAPGSTTDSAPSP